MEDIICNKFENDMYELLDSMGCVYLGAGYSRRVYTYGEDKVIKIARANHSMYRTVGIEANLKELELWTEASENEEFKDIREWLAPTISISDGGLSLIQMKTEPLPDDMCLPTKVPNWITDLKRENCGMLDGEIVFHDYALTLCNINSFRKHRLVKAHW